MLPMLVDSSDRSPRETRPRSGRCLARRAAGRACTSISAISSACQVPNRAYETGVISLIAQCLLIPATVCFPLASNFQHPVPLAAPVGLSELPSTSSPVPHPQFLLPMWGFDLPLCRISTVDRIANSQGSHSNPSAVMRSSREIDRRH